MNDGWKFAEELLGVAAEALKARREAEARHGLSGGGRLGETEDGWRTAVETSVAADLNLVFLQTGFQQFATIGECIAEVRRIAKAAGESSKVRDAALEEAKTAIKSMEDDQHNAMFDLFNGQVRMLAGERLRTFRDVKGAIDALKSKPAITYDPATDSYTGPCTVGDTYVSLAPTPVLDPSPGRELLHADTSIRVVSANTRDTGRVIRYGDLPAGTIRHVCRLTNVQAETYVIDEKYVPTVAEPVHDFGWALARMREGKKVRRPHWGPGDVLWILAGALACSSRRPPDIGNAMGEDWQAVK